jgi:glycosyltransferase involved in cell wall biosynthesis
MLDAPKKSIIIVIDAFTPGGAQRNLQLLVPVWLERGYSVSLVLLQDNQNELELDFSESRSFSIIRIHAKNLNDFGAFFRLRKIFRENRPTLIFANLYWSQLWSSLAKHACPMATLIWVEHNTYIARTRIKWFIFRILSQKASQILAVSNEIRDYLNGLGIPKVSVIHNSVSPYLHALEFEKRERIFLFIGRLIPQKNPELALRAFLAALEDNVVSKDFKLLFIGDGELKENLMQIAKSDPNGDQVEFLGFLSQPEVRRLLRRGYALLLSSHIEGMPLVRLEALEFGLCHITTHTSGIQGLFEFDSLGEIKTPGVVIADDLQAFKAGIAKVLSAEYGTEESAEKRRSLVRDYYPERVADDYLNYEN